MSLFDQLAGLSLKIQPPGDRPYQWIYAVDDAWFHPQATRIEIKDRATDAPKLCKPVFDFSFAGGERTITREMLDSTEESQNASNIGGLTIHGNAFMLAATEDTCDYEILMKRTLRESGADHDVVRELFRFIFDEQDKGNRYGICFCSFEWFWMNISAIDQPQNAVFFDIRHLLGQEGSVVTRTDSALDTGQLRDEWRTALDGIGLFSEIQNHMERLGWYLHYCLKFAKVPNQAGPRPAIADNHIQIVSSAVNPGSGRSDAMSDYSQVQEFIWAKLAPLGGNPVGDITPDRFTFSPMPKGGAMKTGLSIFNNSFRHAADWNAIKAQWCKDIRSFYDLKHNGHYDSPNEAQRDAPTRFRCRNWFPEGNVKARVSDPLYINQQYYNGGLCGFLPIRTNVLLKLLALSGVREFPRNWTGFDNREVILPSCPGFVFVFLLVEFAHALGQKEGQNPVGISYSLDDLVNPKQFTIAFKLGAFGMDGLRHCYEKETRPNDDRRPVGSATTSLWKLVKYRAERAVSHELPEKQTFPSLVNAPVSFCSDFPRINWHTDAVSISLKTT